MVSLVMEMKLAICLVAFILVLAKCQWLSLNISSPRLKRENPNKYS